MMKTMITGLCLIFAVSLSRAQMQPGTFELSLSGNITAVTKSVDQSSSNGTSNSTWQTTNAISLAIRPGVFLVPRLEFESEFFWLTVKGGTPAISISGNLSYNFTMPKVPVVPFVLVGYGIGNGVPEYGRLSGRSSSDMNIPVLNLGVGAKVFLAKRVAFRAEYRYQRYTQDDSFVSGSNSISQTTVQTFHNLFFGFSVFLP